MDPKEKEGAGLPAQEEIDKWLEDLDKEMDKLEEEQKERWSIEDKPE